jgi:hypothetical protein
LRPIEAFFAQLRDVSFSTVSQTIFGRGQASGDNLERPVAARACRFGRRVSHRLPDFSTDSPLCLHEIFKCMTISTKVPPVPLVRVIERARHHLLRLHQSPAPAPAVMVELITGTWLSQAITVAAELRIADALAEKPLGIGELAGTVGSDPDALGRLLRALIGRGIFRQRRDGRYDLTPLAQAPHRTGEHWSHCIEAVRTGEAVVPKLRGQEAFDYVASEPELSEVFNQA